MLDDSCNGVLLNVSLDMGALLDKSSDCVPLDDGRNKLPLDSGCNGVYTDIW